MLVYIKLRQFSPPSYVKKLRREDKHFDETNEPFGILKLKGWFIFLEHKIPSKIREQY